MRRNPTPIAIGAHLTLAFAAGCTTNPATGRSQFVTMTTHQEIALGTEAMPALTKEYGGEVASPQLREYVRGVGLKLAQHTEAEGPSLPWEFTVLDSDVINAFALPGGKVFISRGLLEKFENEAQVAGVLGHEIGHVTAQHTDERVTQASLIAFGTGLAGVATRDSGGWAQAVPLIVGAGGQGYLLTFSRSQESEADTLGLKYMTRAGYDPHGMLEVLGVLRDASEGGQPPEFLSTHPHPETRIDTVTKLLQGPYRDTQNNPAYQKFPERFEQGAKPFLATQAPADNRGPAAESRSEALWCSLCAASHQLKN
jgi:predicted Zn-dependent protease